MLASGMSSGNAEAPRRRDWRGWLVDCHAVQQRINTPLHVTRPMGVTVIRLLGHAAPRTSTMKHACRSTQVTNNPHHHDGTGWCAIITDRGNAQSWSGGRAATRNRIATALNIPSPSCAE